jgi:hypothetical protein
MSTKQWIWMMNFCAKNSLPPAQNWAWEIAKIAWYNRNE